MALFFFDVHDGRDTIDLVGTDFETLRNAQAEAIRTAGELLKEVDPAHISSGQEWRMVCRDEAGQTVFTLIFNATLDSRAEDGAATQDAVSSTRKPR